MDRLSASGAIAGSKELWTFRAAVAPLPRTAPPRPDGRASLSPDPASPAAWDPRGCSSPFPRRASLRRGLRPRENAATLLRGARAPALALAALAVLALAVPELAAAQTVTLVSNTGQADASDRSPGLFDYAQPFNTGSNSGGYNLAGIVLDFGAAPTGTGTLTITVRENSSGNPSGTVLYTLTNPTFLAGLNEFLAPLNAELVANTRYWVMASYSADSGGPDWERTQRSNGLDTGAAAGWAIDGSHRFATRGSTVWTGSGSILFQIAVKGSATPNNAPVFADATASRSFTETVGDAAVTLQGEVGAVVTATDADDDSLTYTLEGTDAAKFYIVEDTGQIRTDFNQKYDREAKASYSVTVKADDGNGGTDTIAVTISVDNAVEKPVAPAIPTVTATSGSTTSLDVSWMAPANTGRPAITGYKVEYRPGVSGNWLTHAHTGTGTTATIASLTAATSYQVQVLAVNSDGDGPFSSPGAGTTGTVTNTAPTSADEKVEADEDFDYTFASADFAFTDTDAGDSLASVKILTLPASGRGTLTLSGTAIGSGDLPKTVPAAEIDDLKYSPPANLYGTDFASFTFKVNDGTVDSAGTYTMTIDVTAANDPATGEPTISGTARVGRMLTASTAGIMDVDGLPSTFSYRWLRKVGATTTSISGANSRTYTLQAADFGNNVAVRVSFTDTGGNSEMRTSGDYPTSGTVQANNTLVSNAGQIESDFGSLAADDLAQSFTTGTNATGYTLSSIELKLDDSTVSTNTPTVKLYSGSANGTEVSTFTGPATLGSRIASYTFTPFSTVTLRRSTTYWVVAEGDTRWTYTRTGTEDANPAMGWSIADNYEFRTASLTGSFTATNTGDALQIRVNGTLGGIVLSSDATLSALALEDASDDSAIDISPTFASGTTSYTASVDNDVDGITIKPTVNESNATVEYLDSSDTEIADAISGKTGQQVLLAVGANTIKVKVTAEDTTTANPYTVVVTRAAPPNTAPTAANNTVTTGEDRAYAFTADDFEFDDDDAGDTLASVKIVTVPAAGTLALDGTAVTALDDVTKAQIDGDMLTFAPARDAHGVAYTTFTFKVNDGTVDSASAYTMTIDVTDAPAPVCAVPNFAGEGRRQIWTGTVTVAPIHIFLTTIINGYGFEFPTSDTLGSSLLPSRAFSIGSHNYTITTIAVGISGKVVFTTDSNDIELTTAEADVLRLHLCDESFDFMAIAVQDETSYRWDASLDWSHPVVTRTVYLSLPTNHAATGEPAITGTAQVGQELTADASPIMDDNGLPSIFTYQWLRVDADGTSNEEDITGETDATYTLTDDDLGKKVKVKVSFVDILGSNEQRTSAPTATVIGLNSAPVFSQTTQARSIAENTAAGQNVGAAVTATDADAGDNLTYMLGGADMASFDFVGTTGQIRTKSGVSYDFEAKSSYTVTVTATDNSNATAVADVTISVTDVDEPPSAPATPMVSAVSGSTTSLSVSWAAPANAGKPAIANYDVQYRVGSSGTWSDGPEDVTGTTTTVSGLVADTLYEARVRATNAEGDSGWSDPPGSGRTNAPTNNAPVFSPAMPEREIAENTAAGVDVGAAVTATDADAGDNLTYTLGGADVASFDFVETTGQIRTKAGVSYDHEAKSSYTVTVTASDGTATADASVTIGVTDVDEPPSAPATISVSAVAGSTTSLTVSWTAPANAGKPAIANYDVQYRVGSSGTWSDGPEDVTGTTTTIASLVADTLYEARVRATNAEGDSGWSDPPGSGRTNAPTNNAPVFDPAMPEREIAENTAAGVNVGAAVTATDADAGDTLSYTLGGADVASFDFVETTGQIRTKAGVSYDHEAKSSYTVTVTASDGTATADASVTIGVTDVDEPPSAPATPMVSAVSGSTASLSVSWAAPANAGKPAIANYDVQYRVGSSGTWSDGPEDVTGTTTTIASLVADTLYEARVRASNAEGDSGWSEPPGSGRTNAPTNNAPVFSPAMPEREIAENTAAGVDVGAAVTATDADAGDNLTYMLGGADMASFDFVGTTGQIRTKSGVSYDHEAKASYTVTVTASDGTATADASVTIGVTDVDEPPNAPATPTVSAVSGSTTSLSVSWAAPANAGKPAIDNYDVQYRLGSSGAWTDGPQDVTGTITTITSLATDTAYQARVRATNAEGDSGWSDPPGSGRTNAASTSAPGAPGNLRTTPGDGRVTLAWTAPGSDGGAAIEKYRYRVSADGGSSWDPDWTDVPDGPDAGDSAADETTFTVSGLINGTEYVFQLRAVNSVGEGRAASATGTPVRAPLPPGSGFLVGNFGQPADGASQVYVTHDIVGVFTTGARGAELHNIELRLFTRRPNIAVLPIPSVTLYSASVTDTRARRGERVAALTAAPGSPRPSATAQTVAFTAPGGTRLEAGATYLVVLEHTSYVRVESTTFPAEDAGGAPGWAIDGIGSGNSSPYSYGTTASLLMRVNGTAAGAPVATAPDAPASLGAAAGNARVRLIWAPPRSDGGAGIEKYQYRYSAGSRVDPDTAWTDVPDGSDTGTSRADERSVSVTELDNGRQYAFELRAVNGVRAGAAATATATPAAARRTGFPVSNFGQPVDGSSQISVTQDIVGAFTAGALGATLDSIEFRLYSRTPDIAQVPSATLYRGSVTDTRATPGTRVATLTAAPGSPRPAASAQTIVFTAPGGTRLEARATYLVVLAGSGFVRVEHTHSSAQDAGGASGWTIDGVGAGNSSPYSYGTSDSLLMSVNGTTARAQRAVREEAVREKAAKDEQQEEEEEEQVQEPATSPDPDRGISLSTSSSSAIEGQAATISVRRAGPTDRTTSVAVQVFDSALTGAWPIDLDFRSGVATATATVAIPFDGARPASRTVTVRLASVEEPYSVGSPSTLTFNVTDRDAALSVDDASVSEGPGATLAFAVTLDRTRDREVRVKYATSDGTATQGDDYTGVSGTLRFAAGETTKTVSVPVLDDAHDEGSETLTLTLSSPRRAVIDDDTAVGTIVNSDPLPNAWLSRFGRAASDHVVQSIGRRLEGGARESHLTVMGWRADSLFESSHPERDGRERRPGAPGSQPDGSVRAPDGRIGAAGATAGATVGATRGVGAMSGPGAARPAFDGTMTQGFPPMQGGTLQSPARAVGGLPGNVGGNPASAAAMGARDNRWLDLMGRLFMSLGPNGGEALAMPGLRDMVMGSSFYYGHSPDAGPLRGMNRLTAWGESASTRFSGAEGKLSLDGEVNTAILGADGEWGRWLAGLALSYSEGEGGYRQASAKGGAVSSTLSGINPYARYRLDERTSFWGTLGYGSGRLTLTPDGAESSLETDMTNAMAAFGGRGVLSMRAGESGQFELALRSDAMLTDTASMAVAGLSGGEGATSRIRLILEGSGSLPAFGGVLAPTVEAGLRYDGGDAETGAGLEVGGGLAYDKARLTVQVDGRVLLTHRDRDYEEWGYSLSFAYKPASDGRGLRYQAGSQWGATQSGVQSLWSLQNAGGLANGARTADGQRYTAELGYGFGVRRLWYPYVGTESGGASSQALRLGINLNAGSHLEAGLEIGRRAHLSCQIENDIRLQWQARW